MGLRRRAIRAIVVRTGEIRGRLASFGGAGGRWSAASVTHRVLSDLQPGQIVLVHVGSHPTDGSTLDVDALPEVIRRIRAAGTTSLT